MDTETHTAPPQTIRRRVDTETYEDIASGVLSFTVCAAEEDLQIGDYFVFVETTEQERPRREVYRRVSIVVQHDDSLVVGFVPLEYAALSGAFAQNSIVVAFAIEKRDGTLGVVGPPAYLPVLAAPYIDPHQLCDFLGTDVWPEAQYSIMLRGRPEDVGAGQQDINIDEIIIMCRTSSPSNDGDTDAPETDRFIAVDHRFLMTGKLKDEFGNAVTPYFGELEDHEQYFEGLAASEMDRVVEIDNEEGA